MGKIFFKLLGLLSLLVVLGGCTTLFTTDLFKVESPSLTLQSEKTGIPQAYQPWQEQIQEKLKKSSAAYHFEFVIRSEPGEAEVLQTENGKPVALLGRTPLAIPCYIIATRMGISDITETAEFFSPKLYHFEFFNKAGNPININVSDGLHQVAAVVGKLHNITVRKENFYNFLVEEDFYKDDYGINWYRGWWRVIGCGLHARSIEVNCSLVSLPERFDKGFKKLIEEGKFREAEDLKNQRIAKLRQAIEREGLRDEYLKEIKRLKRMGDLADPQLIKLKKDLDKAIEAGNYDQASKIKEIIEYKQKSSLEDSGAEVDEEALKYTREGLAYARQDYYKDALESFRKAIKVDPTYVDAYVNAGKCCINLRRFQEAIDYAEKALKLEPGSSYAAHAYFSLGVTYENLKQSDKAIENYQKALAECAAGECSDDFVVIVKKRLEGLQ